MVIGARTTDMTCQGHLPHMGSAANQSQPSRYDGAKTICAHQNPRSQRGDLPSRAHVDPEAAARTTLHRDDGTPLPNPRTAHTSLVDQHPVEDAPGDAQTRLTPGLVSPRRRKPPLGANRPVANRGGRLREDPIEEAESPERRNRARIDRFATWLWTGKLRPVQDYRIDTVPRQQSPQGATRRASSHDDNIGFERGQGNQDIGPLEVQPTRASRYGK